MSKNAIEIDLLPRLHIITHEQEGGWCWSVFAKEMFRVRYVQDGAARCEEAAGPERHTGGFVASVEAGSTIEVVFADGMVERVTVSEEGEG